MSIAEMDKNMKGAAFKAALETLEKLRSVKVSGKAITSKDDLIRIYDELHKCHSCSCLLKEGSYTEAELGSGKKLIYLCGFCVPR